MYITGYNFKSIVFDKKKLAPKSLLVIKMSGEPGNYFTAATEISRDLTPRDNNMCPSPFSLAKSPENLVTTYRCYRIKISRDITPRDNHLFQKAFSLVKSQGNLVPIYRIYRDFTGLYNK